MASPVAWIGHDTGQPARGSCLSVQLICGEDRNEYNAEKQYR